MSIRENCSDSITLELSLDLLRDTYNYNHWIYSMIRPYLGDTIIEVGSGPGNITRFLLAHDCVVCLEPDPNLRSRINELASKHLNLSVKGGGDELLAKEVEAGRYDTVVCLNVLEHIEDDAAALLRFMRVLREGGRLVLYVPACEWAYGEIDRRLHHWRRYGRGALKRMVREAGFEIVRCRYVNFAGVFGWWWASRVKKEQVIDRRKAHFVDRLVPFISAVELLIPPLLGQSLLLVAKK
jgi:SAM-dependent methyltransferase